MKKRILQLVAVVFLTMFANSVKAQDYYFWVLNNRTEDLNELKIREKSDNNAPFSNDLLPENLIEQGVAFWVKVSGWNSQIADVQITDMEGNPMEFILNTVNGGTGTFDFIRLNIATMHTLELHSDNTYSVYNEDVYELGEAGE